MKLIRDNWPVFFFLVVLVMGCFVFLASSQAQEPMPDIWGIGKVGASLGMDNLNPKAQLDWYQLDLEIFKMFNPRWGLFGEYAKWDGDIEDFRNWAVGGRIFAKPFEKPTAYWGGVNFYFLTSLGKANSKELSNQTGLGFIYVPPKEFVLGNLVLGIEYRVSNLQNGNMLSDITACFWLGTDQFLVFK